MILFLVMVVFSPFTAVIPALYLTYLIVKRKIKIQRNYWNLGLIILSVWSAISALINKSVLSFLGAFGILLYLAISVFCQKYFTKQYRINRVLIDLVYLTTFSAICGIAEKITFIMIGYPKHRIFSTFGNPNMTGAWFASVILIIIYLKDSVVKDKRKVVLNLCLVCIVVALLLTESSGAFFALIGSLFIYYILKKDKNRKSIISAFVSVLVVALFFIVFQRDVNSISPIGDIVVSFNSRYDIWEGSIKMFTMKPIFGWGLLGTWEHGVDFMSRNGNSIHSHNLWLTFLVSVGIVGLLIYLVMKYRLFMDLFKLYRKNNRMVPLLAALNMMVIIQGLVDCSLYAPQLGILFMATSSIIYNLANDKMIKNKGDKNLRNSNNKSDNDINDIVV